MLDSIHACEKVLAASAEFLLKNGKSVDEAHLMFNSVGFLTYCLV